MTTRTFGNGLSAGALILLGPCAVLALWLFSSIGANVSPALTLGLAGVLAMSAVGGAALMLTWGKTL
jgi:hypothetical protein